MTFADSLRAEAEALRAEARALEMRAAALEARADTHDSDHAYEPGELPAGALAKAPAAVRKRDGVEVCSRCGCVRSGPNPWHFFDGVRWLKTKPACRK